MKTIFANDFLNDEIDGKYDDGLYIIALLTNDTKSQLVMNKLERIEKLRDDIEICVIEDSNMEKDAVEELMDEFEIMNLPALIVFSDDDMSVIHINSNTDMLNLSSTILECFE